MLIPLTLGTTSKVKTQDSKSRGVLDSVCVCAMASVDEEQGLGIFSRVFYFLPGVSLDDKSSTMQLLCLIASTHRGVLQYT